jgi:spore coat protein U-like protein
MAAPGGLLGYNVYTDPARTRVWATGSGGTVVASGSMTVGPGVGNRTRTATHTVYGRMPALQDAPPGTYLDTLLLTLSY